MNDLIVLTSSKERTNFYLSINDHLDLLEIVDNQHQREVCQVYLNDIIIHLRILRSNLPDFKVVVLAESDFIGTIRKALIRNRVTFDRSRLCQLNEMSDEKLYSALHAMEDNEMISVF